MAQPTEYNRQKDFSNFSQNNPDKPHNGTDLDIEFDAIETTLDETLNNLAIIQRDDTELANLTVHFESLKPDVKSALNSGVAERLRGDWSSSTSYQPGDLVKAPGNNATYIATQEHTSSGSFSNDLSNNLWLEFAPKAGDLSTVASDINNSNNIETVASNITNVNDVGSNIAKVNAVGNDLSGSDTVGTVADDLNNADDIGTVAGSITNVNNVGSSISNVNTVGNDLSGSDTIGTVASDLSGSDDIGTVAGNINKVESAANALASAFKYTFDDNTGMADPGTGELRFDNATLSSVSNIAIDAQTAQSGNPNVSDFIATWDQSTNPVTGQLRVIKGSDPGTFVLFDITGVTDNTGWLQVSVNYLDSNGSFSNGDTLYISYTRTGDKGQVDPGANNDFTGNNTFSGTHAFKDAGELTISSGAITISGVSHTVDTESDASSDDLDTINGGNDGEIVTLRPQNASRTVVVKHNTGNIQTPGGSDITLDDTSKAVSAYYDAGLSAWVVVAQPPSGGGSWELLKTINISGGSPVDVTGVIDSTYKVYAIQAISIKPSTDSEGVVLRYSTDNGSTFLSSSYKGSGVQIVNAGTPNGISGGSDDLVVLDGTGSASGESGSATIMLYNPSDSNLNTLYKCESVTIDGSGNPVYTGFAGFRDVAESVNALRFRGNSSGNLASGIIKVYGVK